MAFDILSGSYDRTMVSFLYISLLQLEMGNFTSIYLVRPLERHRSSIFFLKKKKLQTAMDA